MAAPPAPTPVMPSTAANGPEPLESIQAMSQWSSLPVSWLYAQTAAGTIPCLKLGKYVRFRRSEVLAWLETKRRGPRPE
jgi:excisionase family DNA binding protein